MDIIVNLQGGKYIIPDYSQFRDIHDADLEKILLRR